jgi:hypothetical protein
MSDSLASVRLAIEEGLRELRGGGAAEGPPPAGIALGGTLPTGKVAKAVRSAPGQGGRPVYHEEDVVKQALREARQEGQRLSPYTKKPTAGGNSTAPVPDGGAVALCPENVESLCNYLRARVDGLSGEQVQEVLAWLEGGA